MAQFDMSKTVNNILSSQGDPAQELVGKVIKTAKDLTQVPRVDVAKLARLPGVGDVFEAAQDLVGAALDIFAPRRPQAPQPQLIQRREFNPFDLVALQGAAVMASKLMEIADRKGGDAGLADAIGAVASFGEQLGEVGGLVGDFIGDLAPFVGELVSEVTREVGQDVLALSGLRQHALKLFITQYRPAHEQITLLPIDQREPNLVSRYGSLATPPEDKLSFWREDAQLNDHHGQWHAVYPPVPPPSNGQPGRLGDRNGELFAYMHMQMLARYDAERLCVDLPRVQPSDPRVQPFDNYRAEIPEGYNPGERVMASSDGGKTWTRYRPRPAGAKIMDIPAAGPYPALLIENAEKFRERLITAAKDGYYNEIDGKIAISADNFGNTIEASAGSVDAPDWKIYGNLHADGHTHFAYFDNTEPRGVMLNLFATSRDPIFWRWHKHIDTIIEMCRKKLAEKNPHDFADAPPVTVRSEDIIVCRQEALPADIDCGELGAKAFGYSKVSSENRWDTDFSSGSASVTLPKGKEVTVTTTAELLTEMRTRTIHPLDPNDTTKVLSEDIDYLSHEDFSYFIRLQNDSDEEQEVTIRIFLTPELWVEDHTTWIEMDRFLHKLKGRERAVVFRPARLSAVIRKPAVGHEELEGTEPRGSTSVWCDCGWPYSLLLPRGSEKGLDFRLLVMLSSDDLTMNDTGEKCTSMSYCGLQDEKYPDKRPMGYPFDRPLPDSISSIIEKHGNWASRAIRIRWSNPPSKP